jgi:DNA-binding response OmpR family regulator
VARPSDIHRNGPRSGQAAFETQGRMVLVVDDDPTQRLLARDALEHEGFTVEEAEDGPEGIAKAYVVKPALIVLDVMMPGLDGFTVCDELRRHAATKTIPILLVTGLNDIESMQRGFDLGATDFITKPVSWQTLAMRVKYIIRSHLQPS